MALDQLSASITSAGVFAPTYEEIHTEIKRRFKEFYGTDVNLDPDGADGQFLALWAKALHDSNNAVIAAYNSFSPATAIGNGLSSVVKVNGITRHLPSKSYADLKIVGQAGTTILNGRALDVNEKRWKLPDEVVIPYAGEIVVTAEAEEDGLIVANPNEINRIATPILGWQSVTNPNAARVGANVETDTQLRKRQQESVTLTARTVSDGLVAGLQALTGVTKATVFENDSTITDKNGIPAHSVYAVVDGGEASEIARVIFAKKSLGVGTHGEVSSTIVDSRKVEKVIKFGRPKDVPIFVKVKIKAKSGYLYSIGESIQESVAAYINALEMGEAVNQIELFCPATLHGTDYGETFQVTALMFGKAKSSLGTADVEMKINEQAVCEAKNVEIELVE